MAIIASLLASILMLLLAAPAAVAVATPTAQAAPSAAQAAPLATQVAAPTAQATPRGASVLHVRVVNLRNSTGRVICTLFNSPMAFPTDPTRALRQIAVPIKDNAAVCSFGGLAPG